jgi:hypothetical protein
MGFIGNGFTGAVASTVWSVVVQVFGRRHRGTIHAHLRPATEKRVSTARLGWRSFRGLMGLDGKVEIFI